VQNVKMRQNVHGANVFADRRGEEEASADKENMDSSYSTFLLIFSHVGFRFVFC